MSTSPQAIVNRVPVYGNAFAPQWLAGFCQPTTPPGYEDFHFVYLPLTGPVALTAAGTAGALVLNQTIPTDVQADFLFYYFWFLYTVGNPNIGDVVMRFRDSRGRRVMTEFIVIEELRGAYPKPIRYRAGDPISFDLQNRGAAAPSVQVEFHGFKRRKVVAQ